MERAQGKDVSTNGLKHPYSAAEINEIVAVLQRLMEVREVVYRVNKQYILSAAQDDRYRTEPSFKLQGSYRNMNKLTEKISPAMNSAEIQQLISDHYLGESQLLTTGAEENLLKLAELRGVMTDEQKARWKQIKEDFLRNKGMGGDNADAGMRMVAQLSDISKELRNLRPEAVPGETDEQRQARLADANRLEKVLETISQAIGRPVEVSLTGPASQEAPVASSPVVAPELDLERLASALASSQTPFLEALKGRQEDQALLGQALILIMQRLGDSAAPSVGRKKAGAVSSTPSAPAEAVVHTTDDFGNELQVAAPRRASKSDWDRTLEQLKFSYHRKD